MGNRKVSELALTILEKETPIISGGFSRKNRLRFYPKPPGIFLPDMTLSEYFVTEKAIKEGYYALAEVEKMLTLHEVIKPGQTLNAVSLVTFYLLHEEGHWICLKNNYINKNKTPEDFIKDYRAQEDFCNNIYFKESIGENLDEQHKSYARIYRQNKYEVIADAYAIRRIISDSNLQKNFAK